MLTAPDARVEGDYMETMRGNFRSLKLPIESIGTMPILADIRSQVDAIKSLCTPAEIESQVNKVEECLWLDMG